MNTRAKTNPLFEILKASKHVDLRNSDIVGCVLWDFKTKYSQKPL